MIMQAVQRTKIRRCSRPIGARSMTSETSSTAFIEFFERIGLKTCEAAGSPSLWSGKPRNDFFREKVQELVVIMSGPEDVIYNSYLFQLFELTDDLLPGP